MEITAKGVLMAAAQPMAMNAKTANANVVNRMEMDVAIAQVLARAIMDSTIAGITGTAMPRLSSAKALIPGLLTPCRIN